MIRSHEVDELALDKPYLFNSQSRRSIFPLTSVVAEAKAGWERRIPEAH